MVTSTVAVDAMGGGRLQFDVSESRCTESECHL